MREFDTLIRGVQIVDGTGAPAYVGSIGISQGKLCLLPADTTAQARALRSGEGLTAVPGFIDAHSHGDLMMTSAYAARSKLSQGITTQVAGQCGVSMFPYCKDGPAGESGYRKFLSGIAPHPDFPADLCAAESAVSYYNWIGSLHSPVHTRCFVGHGALRLAVMGYAARKPDASELSRMKKLLRRDIRGGALGLSVGLVYAPSAYADDDELLSLLQVVSEEGGMFAAHPRDEADRTVEARAETIRLAETAHVPLCLSHMKAAGRDNWGKPAEVLRLVEASVSRGGRILIDTYPYMAGCTSLNVSIPPRYFAHGMQGLTEALRSPEERAVIRAELSRKSDYDNYVLNSGGFSGVLVSACPVFHDAEGMTVAAYAEKTGQDPFDAYCEILLKNGGLGLGIYFHMCEQDVLEVLQHPLTAVGTDGLLGLPDENPHPRTFGTMPRAFRMLTTEHGCCTVEAAIRKMTGLPAEMLGLTGKGRIADGYDADLVLLKLDAFRDRATYAAGNLTADGVYEVYSDGKLVDTGGERS